MPLELTSQKETALESDIPVTAGIRSDRHMHTRGDFREEPMSVV